MTRNLRIIFSFLLFFVFFCQAQNIDESTARGIGINFLDSKKSGEQTTVKKIPVKNSYELAYTAVKDDKVCFYIYNCSNGGYVIVSADDRTLSPILGYSTVGSFNYVR